MRYDELTPEAQAKAMKNYINEFCAYCEIEGEITGQDIIENGILFDKDGNITEV